MQKEKKNAFLSFAFGVWCTARARYNLISNIIKLDPFMVYADTDSIKLIQGYDKKVIDDYNEFVKNNEDKVLCNFDRLIDDGTHVTSVAEIKSPSSYSHSIFFLGRRRRRRSILQTLL